MHQSAVGTVRVGRHRGVSDADLAGGLVANEDWALTEVWRRFAPMVRKIAQRALGSTTEADDIAQEVFCCVLQKIGTIRAPDRLGGFIFGIANHVIKAALRRRKRQRSFTPLPSGAEEPLDLRSADIESRDILRRFDALLGRLSPRHRLIFVLRRLEALTTEEVAAAAQVSTRPSSGRWRTPRAGCRAGSAPIPDSPPCCISPTSPTPGQQTRSPEQSAESRPRITAAAFRSMLRQGCPGVTQALAFRCWPR